MIFGEGKDHQQLLTDHIAAFEGLGSSGKGFAPSFSNWKSCVRGREGTWTEENCITDRGGKGKMQAMIGHKGIKRKEMNGK
jgi:hypothetical protein